MLLLLRPASLPLRAIPLPPRVLAVLRFDILFFVASCRGNKVPSKRLRQSPTLTRRANEVKWPADFPLRAKRLAGCCCVMAMVALVVCCLLYFFVFRFFASILLSHTRARGQRDNSTRKNVLSVVAARHSNAQHCSTPNSTPNTLKGSRELREFRRMASSVVTQKLWES